MGRHSSPEQSDFLRSLFGWFVPWVLVAVVAGVAVWIAVGALGRVQLDASPPPAASPTEPASPEPTPSPSPSPSGDRTPRPPDKPDKPQGPEVELITEGVSVQVLNATTTSGAATEIATRLSDLGFEIAAVGEAASVYRQTTVFWSSTASEDAAKALARRFGWRRDPAPENLSRSVSVHVVVGLDEG